MMQQELMTKYISIITLLLASQALFGQTQQAKLANEYFQKGDLDKALSIYTDLEKDRRAVPLIHANYLLLLLEKEMHKEADRYLDRLMKWYPANLQYQVDAVYYYHVTGQEKEKEKLLHEMSLDFGENQYQLSQVAGHFASRELYVLAIDFYKRARKSSNRSSSFALDMAAVYRAQNDKASMTAEYINYAEGNPANISYVKNLFQNILTEEEDQDYLESTLIQKMQKNPDQHLYADLLIWLELQRKDFYGAFVQARALDRRENRLGDQSMRIGRIAYDNENWEDAIEIFQYVVDNYRKSYNYSTARTFLIRSREQIVKSSYPVDKEAIRTLVKSYQELYEEMGINPATLEALKDKATLHAFYLNEMDEAIGILNQVISNRVAPADLVANSKLDLGDIYLFIGEPWEATLLYSQVEKSNKNSPLGYEAKLRNARLNYYTGNFKLAKDHLDILKLATTRTISNDAIALSLLISDNSMMDSNQVALQQFANIELLIFKNQFDQAGTSLDSMESHYTGHRLMDEVYWLQSKVAMEKGMHEESVKYLDKIIDGYKYDILSDDALYKKATLLMTYLQRPEEALEVLTQFLRQHPGSMYAAEAREKIRCLRGDLVN